MPSRPPGPPPDDPPYPGLPNVGGSGCYLNSCLQLLASAPALAAYLAQHGSPLAAALGALLRQLNSTGRPLADPRAFLTAILGAPGNLSGEQQDAQEFLLALLDALTRQRRPSRPRGAVLDRGMLGPFEGLMLQQVHCRACARVTSATLALFNHITCPPRPTVAAALAAALHPAALDTYRCGCGAVGACTSRAEVARAPAVLIVHLNRTALAASGAPRKDATPTAAADTLRLQQHTYRLQAVLEHLGTIAAGHYVAYRRRPRGWQRLSDTASSTRASTAGIEPYLLLYEQC